MPRSPLALAALATVAVPGLDAFDVRRPAHPGTDFDIAVVIDATRRRWVVRAPVNAAAGAALEAEVVLLDALGAAAAKDGLPFDVPRPVGFAHLPEGGRATVHAEIQGRTLSLDELGPGPGLSASVGRAIAAIHELSPSIVENAGLPVYDAETYRARRQAEVDEAARTGRVPATLLRRWEERLEDVSLWRFRPVVTHGDLTNERILVRDGAVSGILHWGDACVADPADDLSSILVAAPPDATDSIVEAYQLRRTELIDPHLVDRALLVGELALARWLLYGVRSGSAEIVEDAVGMLEDLDSHTRASATPEAEPSLA